MQHDTLLDTRHWPAAERHHHVFRAFDALQPGAALELAADHDPLGLYFEFETSRRGCFDWRYLQSGPRDWHVRITRVAAGSLATVSECCSGNCGGHGPQVHGGAPLPPS
jgi:uncharacterized protein (DUF2249 family)